MSSQKGDYVTLHPAGSFNLRFAPFCSVLRKRGSCVFLFASCLSTTHCSTPNPHPRHIAHVYISAGVLFMVLYFALCFCNPASNVSSYPDTMARTPSNSAQAWPVTHCKASAIVIHPSVFRTSPEAFKQVLMPSAIVWHVIPRLMAGAFCCLARSPRKQTRQPPLAYLPCLV